MSTPQKRGLAVKGRRRWTPTEDAFIMSGSSMSDTEMAALLNRTAPAVRSRRSNLRKQGRPTPEQHAANLDATPPAREAATPRENNVTAADVRPGDHITRPASLTVETIVRDARTVTLYGTDGTSLTTTPTATITRREATDDTPQRRSSIKWHV